MTQKIEAGMISRRTALLGAAFGVALPGTILAVSEAGAQTPGMERREDRREDRQDRREERRDDRQERRDDRRGAREDRGDDRRGVDQPTTAGAAPPK